MSLGRRPITLACVLLGALSSGDPASGTGVTGNGIRMPTIAVTRPQVQHFLRRFSFSASPQTVTSVLSGGISAWLTTQDNWQNIDDSGSELEQLPTQLINGSLPDYNIFERVVYQHMILTQRQLQAKLELHWLDHFAVGLEKVGDPAVMYHYDQAIRANALGNFGTLLAAVSQEAAMLEWLDNNYNSGPIPNENFGREVQQLYSTGLYQLNSDGSVKTGTSGQPLLAYSQKDVVGLAQAMTGYGVVYDPNNNDPQTRFSVQYFPYNHYTGSIKFFGKTQNVPTDGTAINYVSNILAGRPSTAPFQVTELLQRFVTEHPSAAYISAVTAVWQKAKSDPDQIAQVVNAIVNYPDFLNEYRSMPKQPAELVFGMLRQVNGTMQAAANASPGGSLLWELNGLGQELFYPASVFSFYRPGNVETTFNTGTVLYRTSVSANITNASPSSSYTDTFIDVPTLRSQIGSTDGKAIAAYLLDALLDGGSPQIQQLLQHYLGKTPSDNQLLGGIWLLVNAPDYAVN